MVISHLTAGRDIIIQFVAPAEPADRSELLVLWGNVERQWIQGVLEPSVQAAARLEPSLEHRPDAIPPTRAAMMEPAAAAGRSIPAGLPMIDLFDQSEGALLILGGAGSGKTIALLELARDLGERATRQVRSPIPVVINLSTWTDRSTLFDWLVGELVEYRVPRQQAMAWLKDRRLILLLDGLDEVRPEARAACVGAINTYGVEIGMGGIVVCSRVDEYSALGVQLKLWDAVCLQPLTPDQVEGHLVAGGAALSALRAAWQSDDQLRALAETPLMLSVMSVAYRDRPMEVLPGQELKTVAQRREHLFSTYVQQAFARRAHRPWPYPPECIRFWLIWLARQMRQRTETMFLIERLQPDWLGARAERYVYTVASRVIGGAVLGLVFGAIMDLAIGLIAGNPIGLIPQLEDFIPRLFLGMALGVVSGLVAGLFDAWRFERSRRRGESRSRRTDRQVVLDVAGYVLAMALVGWLVIARIGRWDTPVTGLLAGLLIGLLFGVFFGLHDSRRGAGEDIRTVEALRWSSAGARRAGAQGALAGLAVGLVVGLAAAIVGGATVDGKPVDWLTKAIGVALLGAIGLVLGALTGVAFGGLRSSIVTKKATPNQGIALSFRNAVLGGVVAAAQVGVLVGAVGSLFLGTHQGLNAAVVGGLFIGVLAALRDGGLDVIQHYTLRLMLAARGYMPLACARFLDHAVALALLRRAGGGYLFIHRLLLEHFADLTASDTQQGACVGPGLLGGTRPAELSQDAAAR